MPRAGITDHAQLHIEQRTMMRNAIQQAKVGLIVELSWKCVPEGENPDAVEWHKWTGTVRVVTRDTTLIDLPVKSVVVRWQDGIDLPPDRFSYLEQMPTTPPDQNFHFKAPVFQPPTLGWSVPADAALAPREVSEIQAERVEQVSPRRRRERVEPQRASEHGLRQEREQGRQERQSSALDRHSAVEPQIAVMGAIAPRQVGELPFHPAQRTRMPTSRQTDESARPLAESSSSEISTEPP